MRIWSIHPGYLDAKGLVALWRETLLAQNVLLGKTKGYRNHPQLNRFKSYSEPVVAIGFYLQGVYNEAVDRGYNFNENKIVQLSENVKNMAVTEGQLLYEFKHLKDKLKVRDCKKYKEIAGIDVPECHPLFVSVDGGIEDWEVLL